MVVEAAGGVECSVDGDGGAYGWGVVLVGCVGCGGVYVGVGVLLWCLFLWGCGVVPVLVWALEEDEGCCVGCWEPLLWWCCFWWRVVGPVGEVADGVCWCVEWGCVGPGCGLGEEVVELCWCRVGVVAVNDCWGSGVVLGVGVCLLAVYVGDGGWGWGLVSWVVCFPVLGGGGVCE